MKKSFIAAGTLCLSLLAWSAPAAVLFSFDETGGGVVGTISGSVDLTGAIFRGIHMPETAYVLPEFGRVSTGESLEVMNSYEASGPLSFGPGELPGTLATSTTGSKLIVSGGGVSVVESYAGEALAGTLTFAGATFASLGITPGEYVITLPNDTVTLRFGPASTVIPLPATLPLVLGALGLTVFAARRRDGKSS
jgi:hypothetical protein